MKKLLLTLILVLGLSPNLFAATTAIGTGGDATAITGPSTSSISDVGITGINSNVNNPTATANNAGIGNSNVAVDTNSNSSSNSSANANQNQAQQQKQNQSQSQANKQTNSQSTKQTNSQSITQNYEASRILPGLVTTMAVTNNAELYDLKTGTFAQTSNLGFLLWQSWSPDHRELVEGCSDRTKMIVVTDDRIKAFIPKDEKEGKGQNTFVLLNEKTLDPEGLGSITIYPIVGKGIDVDGSTLRADIKEYVNKHYDGLKVYFKKSWAASMYGVRNKGRAGQVTPTTTLWGTADILGGIAGAFGGNNGSTEPLPAISLTVILSDK